MLEELTSSRQGINIVCLCIYMNIYIVCLFVCLFVCVFGCVFVCAFVCWFVWMVFVCAFVHLCRLMAKTCVSSLRKKKGICTYRGGRYGKRSFGSRLLELAKQMKQASRTKQMKQALSLVKTCVQRETSSVAVITTLQELLRVEAADPGADLLAEYVASRCGIKLRSSLFLKKANPVWHVRRGRSAVI